MTHEAHGPTVGSVAEEAARLISLLSVNLTDAEARAAGARASARTGVCETCGHDASAESVDHGGRQQDSACRLCPVCQVIRFVRSISPETIDRLADVVDMVSIGLRGFAESRREASAEPSRSGWQPEPTAPEPQAEPAAPDWQGEPTVPDPRAEPATADSQAEPPP